MQTTIKKTLARQLSPFRCPGCKSRHQILLVQGEYGKKSFLCQRRLKKFSIASAKMPRKRVNFGGKFGGKITLGACFGAIKRPILSDNVRTAIVISY
ncbi:hypothetical protein KI694_09835 [Enterobacter oligotrophicus]|uniref:hypothetical protein n=1 Tax=Enterobacter oligotrophicus TaxID=2478464 RepID=UPI001C024A52|nr:hypothetical protein [Enterobacter oligotrophicus]ELW1645675.1 hypothetical protein [Enterobacter oligotrophicus]MBT9425829.1 hypothetical protein [Enterobacter oligotrophicus]